MIAALFKNCFKCFLGVAVTGIVVTLSAGVQVYAGGINSNEARVLSVARGGFSYNNEIYTARQEYVDQLIAYLTKDDVNLTESQADKAINTIYSNIEKGVNEGYIVKQGSPEDNIDPEEEVEITEISPEQEEEGITDISQIDKPTKEPGEVVYNDNGKAYAYDSEGIPVASLDGVMKNTGLTYGPVVVTVKAMSVIFVLTIISAAVYIISERRRTNGS